MKHLFKTIKNLAFIAILTLTTGLVGCSDESNKQTATNSSATAHSTKATKKVVMKYGIPIENLEIKYDTIKKNQTVSDILYSFGFNNNQIYNLTQCPDTVFNVRKIRPGQVFALLCEKDDEHTPRYVIYEESPKSYITFDIDDSYRAKRHHKAPEWRESEVAGVVESSLWVALEESGASPLLAVEMSNIFGWSIDFFGIQKGDEFRIIYAQEYVDNTPLNNYKIIAASFCASKNLVYAIPFEQDGEMLFYNTDGNSLEGAFLKAPLDYYRISSKFSNSRMHPVLKRRRPHHGVDYAAPKGTPVHAVADGVVTFKGWGGGGGNTLKIKHAGNLVTGYLHLSGYAKGIKQGSRVSQGQLIGYVGSTGTSTGPHLDYRIWKNGANIDPLKVPQEPAEPIAKQNVANFEIIRDRIVAELNGTASPEMIVTQLDSVVLNPTPAPVEQPTEEPAEEPKQSKREKRRKR